MTTLEMACCVPSCTSNDRRLLAEDYKLSYVTFPKDPSLRTAWLQALGMSEYEPSSCTRVCSEHFRAHDVIYEPESGHHKVKAGAVPKAVAEHLDELASLKVCRICLATNRKMYYLRGNQLEVAYQQVTGMIVGEGDKLPQKVCWECAHRLIASFKFKAKSLLAHRQLIQLLYTYGQITVGHVKAVNLNQCNLTSNLKYKYFDPDECQAHLTHPALIKAEAGDGGDGNNGPVQAEVKVEHNHIVHIEIKQEPINDAVYEASDPFDDSEDYESSDATEPEEEEREPPPKNRERIEPTSTPKRKLVESNSDSTVDSSKPPRQVGKKKKKPKEQLDKESPAYVREREKANARKRRFLDNMSITQKEIKKAKDRAYYHKRKAEKRERNITEVIEEDKLLRKRKNWKNASKRYREKKKAARTVNNTPSEKDSDAGTPPQRQDEQNICA